VPDTPVITNKLLPLRTSIDTHIEAYLQVLPGQLGYGISQNGELMLDRLREFALRPGKRIRGALAIIGYEMFGGKQSQTGLDLALAVELTQDYLLMVDDVMDRSDQRRGGQTVHRQYQHMLERDYVTRDPAHLGNMLAVNAGMITQHLAAQVLSDIDEAPARVVRAMQLFQANVAATGFGQMDDLMNEAGQALDLDGTRRMYILKSSYYSFINPLQLGAVLAGADDEQLLPLRQFGEQAGLAFQLQDDIIGMFGDQSTTGKSVMDDLREGKMTFLMRHALAHANDEQLQMLQAALGNPQVTAAQHVSVCALLERLGSREYVATEARKAAQAGLDVLAAQTGWDKRGKAFLTELLEFVVSRNR
jgi:geranylgeranyl diphosphate synthase type I